MIFIDLVCGLNIWNYLDLKLVFNLGQTELTNNNNFKLIIDSFTQTLARTYNYLLE